VLGGLAAVVGTAGALAPAAAPAIAAPLAGGLGTAGTTAATTAATTGGLGSILAGGSYALPSIAPQLGALSLTGGAGLSGAASGGGALAGIGGALKAASPTLKDVGLGASQAGNMMNMAFPEPTTGAPEGQSPEEFNQQMMAQQGNLQAPIPQYPQQFMMDYFMNRMA